MCIIDGLCVFLFSMKNQWISFSITRSFCFALLASALLLSCTKDPNYPTYNGQSRCQNGVQDPDEFGVDCGGSCLNPCNNTRYLEGEIFRRVSLDIRYEYIVTGPLVIRDGGSLELPAGTQLRVRAGVGAYIAVTQGGDLFAWGTPTQPVRISSIAPNPQAGDWGGIIICGLAPLEDQSTKRSPLGDYFYGGNRSNDTSGYLRYLKIEHAGATQEDGTVFNGISFYGVGAYTQVDHVWVDGAAQHGIGIDGGNLTLEHILVSNSGGNGIDLLSNWQGHAENLHLANNALSGLRISDVEDASTYTSSFILNTLAVIENGTSGIDLHLSQTQAQLAQLYIKGHPLGLRFNEALEDDGLLNSVYFTENDLLSNRPDFNAQHQNAAEPPFEIPNGFPSWVNGWNSL